jgi:hypothetical protein
MALYARAAQGLGYLAEATGAIDLAEEGLEKIDNLTGKRASKFLRKEAAKVMGLKKGDAFETLPRTVLPIVRDEQLSPALRSAIRAIGHETEGIAAINNTIELLTDQAAKDKLALAYTTENNFNYRIGGVYQGFADVGAIAADLAIHDAAMFYNVADGYKQSGADVADLSQIIGSVKTAGDKLHVIGDHGYVEASTGGASYSGSNVYVWGNSSADSRTMTVTELDGDTISFSATGDLNISSTPTRGYIEFNEYFLLSSSGQTLSIKLQSSENGTTWVDVPGAGQAVAAPNHIYYHASFPVGTSAWWRVLLTASSSAAFTVGSAALSTGVFQYYKLGFS